MTDRQTKSGQRLRIMAWGGAAALLLVPLAAMRVTDGVNWSPFDFLVAAVLIGTVGLGLEAALRLSSDWRYRAAAALALLSAFLLTWGNLAVGLIGSEENPLNRLVWGVLAVAFVGAALARLRPAGMAAALVATAAAQIAVGLVALAKGEAPPVAVIGVFTVLWLASAWLFGQAARAARVP